MTELETEDFICMQIRYTFPAPRTPPQSITQSSRHISFVKKYSLMKVKIEQDAGHTEKPNHTEHPFSPTLVSLRREIRMYEMGDLRLIQET